MTHSSARLLLLPAALCVLMSARLPAAETVEPSAAVAVATTATTATTATAPTSTPTTDIPDLGMEDPGLVALQLKLEHLTAANQLRAAELERQLAGLAEERQRIETATALAKARLEADLSEFTAEQRRLEAQAALAEQQSRSELRDLRLQGERSSLETQIQQAALGKKQNALTLAQLEAQQEMQDLQLLALRRQEALASLQHRIAELDTRLALRSKVDELAALVETAVAHPAEPFDEPTGVLTISDRRIPLNGPIIYGSADSFEERIHFFNNRDAAAPIFIVIDSCPGGSIMEGYRILKAMEASRAPIHVVVKSFAASMAAVITTDADRSYALPNAIILHHQPWSFAFGNLAEQQEQVEVLREWARRLHARTAGKMGTTVDELYQTMYTHSVTGDWEEFADRAVELHWVDRIVQVVREDGVRAQPTEEAPRSWWLYADSGDAGGRPVPVSNVRLPRPQPFDAYFLYNRDERYRW